VRNKSPRQQVVVFMKKTFSFGAVFAISGLLWAQFVQPASVVRQAPAQASILVGAKADAHVVSLFERSCQNCHSLKTEWPVYSRIFPFSWLVEHDVQEARAHMNLSRWQIYDDEEKSLLLSEIGSVVRTHEMPPGRYTLVHPEARLTDAEANEIYQWTRAERRLVIHPPEE
jgi:Haem-binding domain